MRFSAALCIVVFHFQFYFYPLGRPAVDDLPFSSAMRAIYLHGHYAVPWFWVLSGFVFSYTYKNDIKDRNIGFLEFIRRRFARLYPLHFLTLTLTAAVFYLYETTSESPHWWYASASDWYAFGSHLLLASNWFTGTLSFNGPVWSVSIEVLVYIFFFCLTRARMVGVFRNAIIVAVSLAFYRISISVENQVLIWVTNCLACFYIGALVFEINYCFKNTFYVGAISSAALALSVLLVFFRPTYALTFVVPAALILALCALRSTQIESSPIATIVAWLGNLTYGSYLLHFPISVVIFLAARQAARFGHEIPLELIMILYVGATFVMAWLSFNFYEGPTRRMLNRSPRRSN